MADEFVTGRAVDYIVLLMLLEAIALLALRRHLGRGPAAAEIIWNLVAGAALLWALRAALLHRPWMIIAAWLLAALAAHVGDMGLRWIARLKPSAPSAR